MEVLRMEHESFDFTGEWYRAFDKPERTGVWFIWGNSGNGKSTFALMLAKYLTQFGTVVYNSMEEGGSKTIKEAYKRVKMYEAEGKLLLVSEDMETLKNRLRKQRAPKIALIDSIQYTQMRTADYFRLKQEFRHHLFIFLSHARGNQPSTKVAERVMYDADLKIWVEGHKAISKGRYIGETGELITWKKGAERYWGGK